MMYSSTLRLLRGLALFCGLGYVVTFVSAADQGGLCLLPCMQGKCTAGNVCECNTGWTNVLNVTSLPCVIPNCSLVSSCAPSATLGLSPPPPPPPPPTSAFPDMCARVNCGRGKCVEGLPLIHCDCEPGYGNIFNFSAAPCVEQCAVSATCAGLDIPFPSTGVSPPTSSNSTGSSGYKNSGARFSSIFVLTIVFIAASLT